MKYIVKKTFAHNSDIFNVGDIVDMNEQDASSFVSAGKLESHVEEKTINAKVDSKEIADAVSKAIAGLVPAQKSVEAKVSWGEHLQNIAKRKTVNITTNTQGQYATTTYWDPAIDADLLRESGIASKAFQVSLSGSNNIYKKNVINATGTPAVFAESATITASQPTITQFTFTLEKVAYRMDVTEEAIEDTGALVQEIENAIPEQFGKFVENGMINGSGTVLGAIVGNTNTVVTPHVSLQNGTIVTENVRKMFTSCKNPARSQWVVSRSAYEQVLGLEDAQGNALFVGPNGLGDAPFGRLLGLPIMISDYCAAVGTVGDIILGDFSKYQIVSKGGLKLKTSSEVSFLTDATVFKFTWRMAGKPVGLKYSATDGTEIGDFIVLDDRVGSTVA